MHHLLLFLILRNLTTLKEPTNNNTLLPIALWMFNKSYQWIMILTISSTLKTVAALSITMKMCIPTILSVSKRECNNKLYNNLVVNKEGNYQKFVIIKISSSLLNNNNLILNKINLLDKVHKIPWVIRMKIACFLTLKMRTSH